MITKTNFHMLREFNMKPEHFGVLNGNEVEQIRNHFQLEERSNIDLQNLRDFVVMFYSGKTRDNIEMYDRMSGIVGVIDKEKWNRGMEV